MTISTETHGKVLVITLQNKAKRNAITSTMLDDITGVITRAGADVSLNAVALRGSGDHFCAGADIAEYHHATADALRSFTHRARSMCDSIQHCPIPVFAVVKGVALGGGMELCLASDMVMAHPSASFGLPELRLGLIPGWGGTQRLPKLVGRQLASHLIFTSGRLDAGSALRARLVAEVPQENQFEGTVDRWYDVLSNQPRSALVASKAALAASGTIGGPDMETELLMQSFAGPDGVEGVGAFVDRRPPVFGTHVEKESL